MMPDMEVEAEPAAMRRWIKEAEPHFVDGELIPWDRVLFDKNEIVEESVSRECIMKPFYADPGKVEVKGPTTEIEKIEVWEYE